MKSLLYTGDAMSIPPLDPDVFDALLTVERKMSIDKFREKYMGLLSYEHGNAPVGMWANDPEVGSPFCEVDIIDRNGSVLFTIPPLLDNSSPVFSTLKGQQMYEALNAIEMYYRASPAQGASYIANLTKDVGAGKINPKHIAMWNKVRKFFKLPPIQGTIHATPESSRKSKAVPNSQQYKLL